MSILLCVPDIILVNILTNYLHFKEYGVFEISNTNKTNEIHFKFLITRPSFILNTTKENWYTNYEFKKWLVLRQININHLLLFGSSVLNNNYINKTSSMIKSIKLHEISKNIDNNTFPNLEILNISDHKFDNYELFNITKCKNIIFLAVLNANNISNFFVEEANSLIKISIGMPELFSYNSTNLTDDMLMNIINKCINLSCVKLFHCGLITDKSISKLITTCTISELLLYCCYLVTNESIIELSKNNNELNITNLKICYCYCITDISIIEIGKKCKNLKILELSIDYTYLSLNSISNNCNELTEITINLLGCDKLIKKSLHFLIHNCKKLIKINLLITKMSNKYYKLLIAISKLKYLEILQINSNNKFLIYDHEFEKKINDILMIIITKDNSKIKLINIEINVNLVQIMLNILNYKNKKKILCIFYTSTQRQHYHNIIIEPTTANKSILFEKSTANIYGMELIFEMT